MKFSESWLREWVNPDMDTAELAHRLTMIGHEVDALEPQGEGLAGVVVGEVLSFEKHPDADRLSVCQVLTGNGETLEVVCGAPNVRQGLKSPFAPVGTKLPNGVKLRKAKIRGVVSNGMLCSAIELGLGDESDGIVELDDSAPTGQSLEAYLGLPDASFDLDLTPNRGDCFSVLGIARDVAALTGAPMKDPTMPEVESALADTHKVELVHPEGCPRFAGRVVRGIDMSAQSPDWMKERLRRSGLRSIHPVVDVTNYVMMELGQPLHAYDQDKLNGPIRPRMANPDEKLVLLDEKEVETLPNTLLITDDSGAIGMAGVMGGLSTAVTDETKNVFFEAAFFPPHIMAGVARQYGMHTDASMRFERGVDPENQHRAIERATDLLIQIAGGEAGPLVDERVDELLPTGRDIFLRKSRLRRILGADVPADRVGQVLASLGLAVSEGGDGWQVGIPAYRFDIDVEDALVEEVARIYGYDELPEATGIGWTPLATADETALSLDKVAELLVAREYQEVLTYSFIDAEQDRLLSGRDSTLVISNPISSEMSVMRSSILPGLINTAVANFARQQDRIRFFEIGKTFHGTVEEHTEVVRIAGIAGGMRYAQQWGIKAQDVDFFDIKADVEAIIAATGSPGDFSFAPLECDTLQPGQAANILRNGTDVGVIGKLHPRLNRAFNLDRSVVVFEFVADKVLAANIPVAVPISKFPAIRRDIALLVKESVSADAMIGAARDAAPALVQSVRIFDVYRGAGVEAGLKSVALGLILQETSRTLTDEDADTVMSAVLRKMQQDFGAELRD